MIQRIKNWIIEALGGYTPETVSALLEKTPLMTIDELETISVLAPNLLCVIGDGGRGHYDGGDGRGACGYNDSSNGGSGGAGYVRVVGW